jgi:hypothetical protein
MEPFMTVYCEPLLPGWSPSRLWVRHSHMALVRSSGFTLQAAQFYLFSTQLANAGTTYWFYNWKPSIEKFRKRREHK